MIRKKKMFSKPRKAYEKARIKEEDKLVERYGLKNKREIWKTLAKINYFRTRAKELAKSSLDEQQILFNKLQMIGLNVRSIADVLALKVEDLLERRLSTVIVHKRLANTSQQARQMIVHKRVMIDNKAINIPSYLVLVSQENLISIKPAKPGKASAAEGSDATQEAQQNG